MSEQQAVPRAAVLAVLAGESARRRIQVIAQGALAHHWFTRPAPSQGPGPGATSTFEDMRHDECKTKDSPHSRCDTARRGSSPARTTERANDAR